MTYTDDIICTSIVLPSLSGQGLSGSNTAYAKTGTLGLSGADLVLMTNYGWKIVTLSAK